MANKKFNIRRKLNLLIHLIVKINNDDIFALASQLAYYLLLSFFPFIIFLITLMGFSNINSVQVLDGISAVVPSAIYDLTSSIIIEIFDQQHAGLLQVSILLAIWSASSGFRAVIKGVNKAYNFKENRSYIKRAIISMTSIVSLAITIILALAMLVFGNVIENYLTNIIPFEKVVIVIWNLFRYAVIIIIMVFIFATIYVFAPAKKLRWKTAMPGAIFSTIGWIITSYAFSFYIDNFSNYSRFYGSLGAVFVLMTWLFLISMIFILGVEINCVLDERRNREILM